MNSERKAASSAVHRFFVLGALSPDHFDHALGQASGGQVDRFLGDLLAGCLPLPPCSATVVWIINAYRWWCHLQRIEQPASADTLVAQAVGLGFRKSRHMVRLYGNDQAKEHIVLHQPHTPLKTGGQLDAAASVFALAVTRWREATGQAEPAPAEPSGDSIERFMRAWCDGTLPVPRITCRSEDLYAAYRHHCELHGVSKPAGLNVFIPTVCGRPGVQKERRQHFRSYSQLEAQSTVITPPGAEKPAGRPAMTASINGFAAALAIWRDESGHTSGKDATEGHDALR